MIDNAALAPFVFGEHPTGVYPLVLYVREGFPVDTFSWPAMVGKRIGMVRGYDYTEKILAFDGWNKDFANDDEQMIIKLKAKRYDYILSDLFSAPILAQKVGIKLKMLKPSVDATYTYLVFNQEKIAVAAQFDRIVGEMIEDGTMVAIYAKYGYSYQTLMQLGQPADTSLKP